MERKSIVIDIPDGMCIDESNSTFEKIVFKKKDTKPRSWKEYCEQQIANKKHGYYIDDEDCSSVSVVWNELAEVNKSKNVLPTKELAEAFLAMMQLMSLRQEWIGDWKPDWNNSKQWKANILYGNKGLVVAYFGDLLSSPLSFPTQEMAADFMNCFKDLLEVAKPLI